MDRLTAYEARPFSADGFFVRLTFTDSAGFFSDLTIDDATAKDLIRRLIVSLGQATHPAFTAPHYSAAVYNGMEISLPATDASGETIDPETIRRYQAAEEAAITAWYSSDNQRKLFHPDYQHNIKKGKCVLHGCCYTEPASPEPAPEGIPTRPSPPSKKRASFYVVEQMANETLGTEEKTLGRFATLTEARKYADVLSLSYTIHFHAKDGKHIKSESHIKRTADPFPERSKGKYGAPLYPSQPK